ncbi:MAG: glycosyltransferase family 4 protein [Solirubrobacteraceae bacterium]
MRLLYLSADPGVPVLGAKGASVHLRALVEALQDQGHDVLVASPRSEQGPNPLPDRVRMGVIPAVRPRECATEGEVRERCRAQATAVEGLAREHAAEAIYERYSLMGVAGARAAGALGVPLGVEVNAPLRQEERRYRHLAHEPIALDAELETFAAARRIFTVSDALRDWLVAQGVEPGRIEVMGNAPPSCTFARTRTVGSDPDLIIGFAGGLKLWHGIATLIEGFRIALERGGRMRLEILGQGPADEMLDRCSLPEGRLLRLGALPHEDVLRRMETWDVGMAPFSAVPDFYFSPLKLFEYMAAGLCPVVSDVGALAEIVEHGRAGVLVAPDAPVAMADVLLELDRDRGRVRELGLQARQVVAGLPTWADGARRVATALAGNPVMGPPAAAVTGTGA